MIPISTVKFDANAEQLVLDTLRSGLIVQGQKVQEFEQKFAELIGAKHAIAVNNGTTSLIASLEAMGVKEGDEVITSPFTFVATLNAILACGATARFADVSADDFMVAPDKLAEKITQKTRVLLPVHLYGQSADMGPIETLAKKNNLQVLEDAAQAHGATYGDKSVGTFGVGSFSFYATKNITTAEGGIITTTDDALADRLRLMRNQGMRSRYNYELAGNNWRMTDIHAAIGISQLPGYPGSLERRRANAAFLQENLQNITGLIVPIEQPGRGHVWHQFTIRITSEARVSRDDFVSELASSGVGCGVYYPKLVFNYPPYRQNDRVVIEDYPVAQQLVGEVVSIPVHPNLSHEDLETIVTNIRRILGASL